ncbi:MAG: hypothetical protein QXH67_04680 [Candidatus Bathyarchaeia archaeon]
MAPEHKRNRKPKNTRGISPVISTVIISGTLLIVLAIASFVSMNILELQLASTEFEQAKSNMLLLDEVIHDVAMRRGSGGYVQFNQRAGGIGIKEEEMTFKVIVNGSQIYPEEGESIKLISIIYRGGSFASGSEADLRGNKTALIVGMGDMLSYLRVEFDNGIIIKLDYNRIRVVDMGEFEINGTPTKFVGINFIRLIMGNMGGSGTINFKVKNISNSPKTFENEGGTIELTVQRDSQTETRQIQSIAAKTAIIFTEILIEVSTS